MVGVSCLADSEPAPSLLGWATGAEAAPSRLGWASGCYGQVVAGLVEQSQLLVVALDELVERQLVVVLAQDAVNAKQ